MLAVAIASAQRGAQNSTHRRVVLVGDFPLFIYCIILYLQIVLGYYIYIYIYTKKKKKRPVVVLSLKPRPPTQTSLPLGVGLRPCGTTLQSAGDNATTTSRQQTKPICY